MRLRIILLVLATSSLILVSFLLPLALLLRTFAADRATSSATAQAQWLAPLVATLSARRPAADDRPRQRAERRRADDRLPARRPGPRQPGARTSNVRLALRGSSFTSARGRRRGDPGRGAGPAPRHRGHPDLRARRRLRQGVSQAWLLLGLIGVGLLGLSVAVSAQLARSLLMPLAAVARASELLADGDLSARAPYDGPPEVRQVSSGLNRLAARIGELLAHERETLADLSHRLRTPLTALRIDAESLRDEAEMMQVIADVDELTRTVNEIIREARRPSAVRRPDRVRRRRGRPGADSILAGAGRGPGPVHGGRDRHRLAAGPGARPGPRCLRRHPARERLRAHAGGRRVRRAPDGTRQRRRLADGRRRRTWLRR